MMHGDIGKLTSIGGYMSGLSVKLIAMHSPTHAIVELLEEPPHILGLGVPYKVGDKITIPTTQIVWGVKVPPAPVPVVVVPTTDAPVGEAQPQVPARPPVEDHWR